MSKMLLKPSYTVLSTFDIFSIILPGTIIPFTRLDSFTNLYNRIVDKGVPLEGWVAITAFFVVSYFIGHASFLVSKIFEVLYTRIRFSDSYLAKLLNHHSSLKQVKKVQKVQHLGDRNNPVDTYHWAYSYIRVKNLPALSELDKNSSLYSLFRSLTLVFSISALWTSISSLELINTDTFFLIIFNSVEILEVTTYLILSVLCFMIYYKTMNWTYKLAFDYVLIDQKNNTDKKETHSIIKP
ncbi:hypothetical protein [Pontibacter anaerobius]|uniref:Uncharacterized protein n=1 Tax=Pontibacter anaerobius TaxID=2993940 RepID=A0ABT3REG7_9BACT|nr:hypothetical protein [Pontibacter anaerobius]MCX2739821.1 hypothetical protein [Pontibacter anaerobius]